MRRPNGYWNLNTLIHSAINYDTISEWSKADMGAYIAARRLGLVNEVTIHMLTHGESISKSKRKWTKKACLTSAKKFNQRYQWEYGVIQEKKWLLDF